MPRSKFQAPRSVESFADVQRALRSVQESLEAVSRSTFQLDLKTHDFTPLSPSFQRASPPAGGMRTTMPKASEQNAGDVVVISVESPTGLLTIFAAPGDKINGSTSNVFSVAGIIELFSNGVNAWNSAAQLAGTAGAPGATGGTGASGVTSYPGLAFAADDDGPSFLIGPPGAPGPAGPTALSTGPALAFPVDEDAVPFVIGPPGLPGAPGATGPTGPAGSGSGSDMPGLPLIVDADELAPWLSIPGPIGPQGSVGPTGATGAASTDMPGLALFVDADELQVGMLSAPLPWSAVLLAGNRSGSTIPTIDSTSRMRWDFAGSTTKFMQMGSLGLGEDFSIQATETAAAATLGIVAITSLDLRNGVSSARVHIEDDGTNAVRMTASGARFISAESSVGLRVSTSGTTAGYLTLGESSSSGVTVAAGDGMFWVSNDTPSLPRFTDDANVDFQMQNALVAQTSAASVAALTTVLSTTPTYTAAASTLPAGAVFYCNYAYQFVRGATATALTLNCFFDVGTFPSVGLAGPTGAGTYFVMVEAMWTVLTTGGAGTSMGWISATLTNAAASADDQVANASTSFVLATNAALAMRGAAQMNTAVAATSITALGGYIQRVK